MIILIKQLKPDVFVYRLRFCMIDLICLFVIDPEEFILVIESLPFFQNLSRIHRRNARQFP